MQNLLKVRGAMVTEKLRFQVPLMTDHTIFSKNALI